MADAERTLPDIFLFPKYGVLASSFLSGAPWSPGLRWAVCSAFCKAGLLEMGAS